MIRFNYITNIKTTLKKILIILFLCLSISIIFEIQNALAVENIQVSSNKITIKKNEEVDITVGVQNTSIASLTLEIYFDINKLEYINKTENSNLSNNRVIYTWTDASNTNSTENIETFSFKAIEEGIVSIIIIGEFYDREGKKIEINDGSVQIQIGENKQVEATQMNEDEIENNDNIENVSSDNTDLKIMRLNHEGISPEFQKDIKEYYFLADINLNELEVTAVPENKNSKVSITGNTNLTKGLNTIEIKVESEDKTKESVYYIYVTKTNDKERANSNLENLAVRDVILFPSFDSNITKYNVQVENKVSKLDILAIPQRLNAEVTIEGNSELKIGDNIVNINVTAEDGISKKKYIIIAHRRTEQEEADQKEKAQNQKEQLSAILENEQEDVNKQENIKEKSKNINTVDLITFILLAIVIIAFVVCYIVNKQKNNKLKKTERK